MKESKMFMAFAKGGESKEVVFNRYIGVAPVSIVSLNPSKSELEKLYNTSLDNNPEYVGVQTDENGNKIPYAKVTFLVKPDPEKTGMDINPISIAIYVRKEYKFNREGTKIRVIDEYGNYGWATKEQCQNHSQILSNETGKPAKLSTNYRPAYVGEIELTDFIKAFLNIPDAFDYVNETWVLKNDADLSVARFENIENLFKGDFSEIKEAISYQPDNKVKILFGVRKNDEGKMYQTFFQEMFLKNSITNYSKLEKELQRRKSFGAYAKSDFEVCDFKIYEVAPTTFDNSTNAVPEFNSAQTNPWFNE